MAVIKLLFANFYFLIDIQQIICYVHPQSYMNNTYKNITTSINVASPHGSERVDSLISINNLLSDIILLGIIISILSLIIIR